MQLCGLYYDEQMADFTKNGVPSLISLLATLFAFQFLTFSFLYNQFFKFIFFFFLKFIYFFAFCLPITDPIIL